MTEISLGRGYAPLAGSRAADRFVLVESPRGAGKTRAILTILVLRAMAAPGARVVLARSTRTRLSQSILVTLEEQVLPSLGIPLQGSASREQRTVYPLPNGSTLIPLGLDDMARLQSVECAWAYVAEATEMTTQDEVMAIAGAMRQRNMPQPQCIVDCNPSTPGHWLHKLAEPVHDRLRRVTTREDYTRLLAHNAAPAAAGHIKRIIVRHQDNPAYWDQSAWDWTQAGRDYLATLGELRGHLRRRWLDGEWVAAEGSVYPEFTAVHHILEPFEIPRSWPCYLAEDPGYDHPTAILLAAVGPNGRLYIVDEIVRRQTTVEQDARDITTRWGKFNIARKLGDPHYMFSANKHNSGETIAQQMAKLGHSFRPAPAAGSQEEIAQQVEMVRPLLVRVSGDGRPMLQVFRGCVNTIRGFQSWGYQRDRSGGLKGGQDRFEDVGDDEMDCVRMLVASKPTHTFDGVMVFGVE